MRRLSLLLLVFAAAVSAADADYGFGLKVSVNWPMQLGAAEVHTLRPNSDAVRQGVRSEDRIIAAEDCEIFGCGARRAEKLLDTSDGAARRFHLRGPDGAAYTFSLRPRQPTTDVPLTPTGAPEPP